MTLGDYRSRQRGSLVEQQVLEHAPLELLGSRRWTLRSASFVNVSS